ncbi:hypothetical protein BH11ACT8_BH11ACT8_03630 [soil metagenome]
MIAAISPPTSDSLAGLPDLYDVQRVEVRTTTPRELRRALATAHRELLLY